ncbi:MAG TPA: hypothetical protein VI074_04430, partial [Propionibacteriaceae bacterium]
RSNGPEYLQVTFVPMQQQLDLVKTALEAQAEFQRKLTEQAFTPMRQVIEGLKQTAKTTAAAGEALKEAGELLTQQASAMNQALSFSDPFIEMTVPSGKGSKRESSVSDRSLVLGLGARRPTQNR